MDLERTIQFLLEQQARFDARQAEFAAGFAARQAEFAAKFAARQAEFAAGFAARQAEFDARQAKFQEDISQINSIMVSVATDHQRTNKILEALAERHVQLAEAQRSTEQKLHVVISALERHIDNNT